MGHGGTVLRHEYQQPYGLNANVSRLAWTGKKEIHYIVPILSGALFGFSYVLNMVHPLPNPPFLILS
jgi:hypothetical protein